VFAADEELKEAVGKWIERKKYEKLVDLWVKGLVVDWNRLYGERSPRRISLPTYPFARERYWIPISAQHMSATSLSFQDDVQFDDVFYEQIIDSVINGTENVDAATQKIISNR
jgi:acyl transferase domain-containing protein